MFFKTAFFIVLYFVSVATLADRSRVECNILHEGHEVFDNDLFLKNLLEKHKTLEYCDLYGGGEIKFRRYYSVEKLLDGHNDVCSFSVKHIVTSETTEEKATIQPPDLVYSMIREAGASCDDYSKEGYTAIQSDLNVRDKESLFLAIASLISAAKESKDGFDTSFSSLNIFKKLYYGFSEFKDDFSSASAQSIDSIRILHITKDLDRDCSHCFLISLSVDDKNWRIGMKVKPSKVKVYSVEKYHR
jgi:hypothetical protein